jgi:thioredoxin-dependent peroxiredoxin
MPLSLVTRSPDFTLLDQHGEPFTLSKSLKQRKVWHLIYFYPKDDTPGCTKEACQFNENLAAFHAAGVPVVGISPDAAESHVRFRTRYGLEFPLLSDPDHVVMDSHGAWGEKSTYGKKSRASSARRSSSTPRAVSSGLGTTSGPTATPPGCWPRPRLRRRA